jgi:hypothetical protein
MKAMLSKSRRILVMTLAVIGITTIPAELFAIHAILGEGSSPVSAWVTSLSPEARSEALTSVETLPLEFRRALLKELSPAERSDVWRQAIDRFTTRVDLDNSQQALLRQVWDLASPDTFSGKSEKLAVVQALSRQVKEQIGEEAYRELFSTAGPTKNVVQPQLPLIASLRTWVRNVAIVNADFTSCNCYHQNAVDCTGETWFCSELQGCEFSYFGCGTWYLEPCDAYCIKPPPSGQSMN